MARGSPASVQIYTKSGLWGPFPSRWPREAPPPYKSIRKVTSGAHFPAVGPGRPRQRTNLYEKWPLGPISQQVAQGGPATVQIHTKSDLWGPFPSSWPREAPPAHKSIRKVTSGAHFPASGLGRARQRTNLYQNWPPGGVSQHMARGSPATLQSYTKCGLWGSFPSRRPRGAPQRISCRKDVNKKCRHIQLFKYR